MITKPLRCAVYARVSSDLQDVENSLDRQLRACQAWAERNGHTLVPGQVYQDEAKSGASTIARPALQQLLAVLRTPGRLPFDAVLLDDASRLDRGGHMAQLVDGFRARSVRLVSVDSKSGRDLTDEDEDLRTDIETVFNRQQLREIARRTRNGLASKVRNGWHAGGRVYGYRLVPVWPEEIPAEMRSRDNRTGTRVEIHQEQAATVRRIFEWYAERLSFRVIAQRLTASGLPSPGAGWNRTVRLAAPAWDVGCVRAILRNPKYRGEWTWNAGRWVKRPEGQMAEAERARALDTGRHPRRRVAKDREEWITQQREDLRIVPEDLWQAVAARFDGRVWGGVRSRSNSPIAGVLRCACGGPMTLHTNSRKGHTYSRIFCSRHRNRGTEFCGNTASFRVADVADPLLRYVLDDLLDPARIRRAVEIVNRKLRQGRPVKDERRASLEAEIRTLGGETRRLAEAIAGGLAVEAVMDTLRAKDARLRAARADLEALGTVPPPAKDARPLSVEDVQARLLRFREDLLQKADPDKARLALARVFEGVTVGPLEGSWEEGWALDCRARSWSAVLRPKTSVAVDGSGGRI